MSNNLLVKGNQSQDHVSLQKAQPTGEKKEKAIEGSMSGWLTNTILCHSWPTIYKYKCGRSVDKKIRSTELE